MYAANVACFYSVSLLGIAKFNGSRPVLSYVSRRQFLCLVRKPSDQKTYFREVHARRKNFAYEDKNRINSVTRCDFQRMAIVKGS